MPSNRTEDYSEESSDTSHSVGGKTSPGTNEDDTSEMNTDKKKLLKKKRERNARKITTEEGIIEGSRLGAGTSRQATLPSLPTSTPIKIKGLKVKRNARMCKRAVY